MSRTVVLIVAYNGVGLLGDWLRSLADQLTVKPIQVVVIDNASPDGTLELLRREFPHVPAIASRTIMGYGGASNLTIRQLDADHMIVSNVDVVYHPDSMDPLVRYLESHPQVGAVGPQQIFPYGTWQRSHGKVPGARAAVSDLLGVTSFQHLRSRYELGRLSQDPRALLDDGYLDGGILALRCRALEEIGGFDPAFPFYTEDADLCHRLGQVGWRLAVVPESEVVHLRGELSRQRAPARYAAAQSQTNTRFARNCLADVETLIYLTLMVCYFFMRHLLSRARQLTVPRAQVAAGARAEYFRGLAENYAKCLVRPKGA